MSGMLSQVLVYFSVNTIIFFSVTVLAEINEPRSSIQKPRSSIGFSKEQCSKYKGRSMQRKHNLQEHRVPERMVIYMLKLRVLRRAKLT